MADNRQHRQPEWRGRYRVCERPACGKPFMPNKADQRYCSKYCADLDARQIRQESRKDQENRRIRRAVNAMDRSSRNEAIAVRQQADAERRLAATADANRRLYDENQRLRHDLTVLATQIDRLFDLKVARIDDASPNWPIARNLVEWERIMRQWTRRPDDDYQRLQQEYQRIQQDAKERLDRDLAGGDGQDAQSKEAFGLYHRTLGEWCDAHPEYAARTNLDDRILDYRERHGIDPPADDPTILRCRAVIDAAAPDRTRSRTEHDNTNE